MSHEDHEHDESCYVIPSHPLRLGNFAYIAVAWAGNVLGTTTQAVQAIAIEFVAAANHRRSREMFQQQAAEAIERITGEDL